MCGLSGAAPKWCSPPRTASSGAHIWHALCCPADSINDSVCRPSDGTQQCVLSPTTALFQPSVKSHYSTPSAPCCPALPQRAQQLPRGQSAGGDPGAGEQKAPAHAAFENRSWHCSPTDLPPCCPPPRLLASPGLPQDPYHDLGQAMGLSFSVPQVMLWQQGGVVGGPPTTAAALTALSANRGLAWQLRLACRVLRHD